MILTDTHTHIYLKDFEDDINEVLKRADTNNIKRFFLPNIDVSTISSLKNLVENNAGKCFPMMGLHPCSVKEHYKSELSTIYEELKSGDYIAVGEIGIDLYWDKTTLNQQIEAFETQINWAKELNLPIVIHCRDSFEEIIEIVENSNDSDLRGIFHCFTGNLEDAKRIYALENFYLGIGGVVTFKNSGLDKIVEKLDLKMIVLETDAPYLTPAPHRGKRNEPAFIYIIAEKIARLKNLSIKEVANITTKNAIDIFGC